MSYAISLIDCTTEESIQLPQPQYLTSGCVPCRYDEKADAFEPIPMEWAEWSITYNYAHYYYEATEQDARFAVVDEDSGEISYGIRGLYGKSAKESIPMLQNLIDRIEKRYCPHGKWKTGERSRKRYFDQDGFELTFDAYLFYKGAATTKTERYLISEGDTHNYWEETAANAIQPLREMLAVAKMCQELDCVWDGD